MKNTKKVTTHQPSVNYSAAPKASGNPSSTLAELQTRPLPDSFYTATGALRFTMTNDAMFHIVFEANREALKAFLCSLLRLNIKEISSVEVTNPIEFGNSVYSKSFLLDLRLLLNNRTVINLEMQVENLSFWKERSVGYLCRSFDGLNKGDSYLNTKPAIHIGILNFDLFPEHPEFYATYHLSNDITHKKYSDSLRLSVLQLKYTDIATEEDRHWELDLWAKFFRADSWEVIHTLAEKNPYIASAAQTIYRVSEDERIRIMCEAREEGEKTQRTLELLRQMERDKAEQELRQINQELQQTKQELQQTNHELQQTNHELQQANHELHQTTHELQQTNHELQQTNHELQQKDTQLIAALARIAELEANQK